MEMIDPSCTGELELPKLPSYTSEEMAERGPFEVVTPTEDEYGEPLGTDYRSRPEGLRESHQEAKSEGKSSEKSVWRAKPSAPRVSGPIWHYSDAAGLIGIASQHNIWATSLDNLNDSAEFEYGRNVLDELMIEVAASQYVHPIQKAYLKFIVDLAYKTVSDQGLFVACASTAEHSLAQWRAYGGSHGHAIVLDAGVQLSVLSNHVVDRTVDSIAHRWGRVLYDEDEQRTLLLKGLSSVAMSSPQRAPDTFTAGELSRADACLIAELLAYCKEPSFREEHEARIVVQAPHDDSINFRASTTGITPYVLLTGSTDSSKRTSTTNEPLPIQKCVVGPFPARNSSAGACRRVLDLNGYRGIEVEISTSTLR